MTGNFVTLNPVGRITPLMCGICGVAGVGDRRLVEDMTSVIAHRGPDDHGYFVDDGISLGNRRLSIIDIEGGHQPVHNEDESVWVTYNGEIYNYKELRETLRDRGHLFYTDTDTEVIVHAYEEWGPDCVERFKGMFGFALWDRTEQRLFVARDRFGKKPVYYATVGDRFYFGSEIKCILQGDIDRAVNARAKNAYFCYRYVPGPETMFEGIYKLQPGNYLIYEDGDYEVNSYWDFEIDPSFDGSVSEAADMLRERLRKTMRQWVRSDVPIGVYLSGGLDSSSVVALLSEIADDPVRTFTVSFDEERFDEAGPAERVAEYYDTDHTEFLVEPDATELLPEIVHHFDQPLADPAAIPTYLLSQKAREHVKVVLTGEGADELFGGYEHYGIMKKGEQYLSPLPGPIRRAVPPIVERVPSRVLDRAFPYASGLGEEGIRRFGQYVSHIDQPERAYLDIVSIFDTEERRQLLDEAAPLEGGLAEHFQGNTIDGLLTAETKVPLPDNLLMKVDKTTMAAPIEARTPLLSEYVADLMQEMPSTYKLRGGTDKFLFRQAMEDLLPEEIFKREKQRFFVPIHNWIQNDIGEFVWETVYDGVRRGHFDRRTVDRIERKFDQSPIYYARQLWCLLNFELWHEQFIQVDQ